MTYVNYAHENTWGIADRHARLTLTGILIGGEREDSGGPNKPCIPRTNVVVSLSFKKKKYIENPETANGGQRTKYKL